MYHADMHGFAGHHRETKERYYNLKDRGIAWLAERGHFTAVYRHGGLVVWTGLGFSLHSTLMPRGGALETRGEVTVFQEAKPRSAREMRLIDAEALLDQLGVRLSEFDRCTTPSFKRRASVTRRMDIADEVDEEDY